MGQGFGQRIMALTIILDNHKNTDYRSDKYQDCVYLVYRDYPNNCFLDFPLFVTIT